MFLSELDPSMLARMQFAFTISFHIIFPAFTIGLATWLLLMEGLWLKTRKQVYRDLYKLWVKIFAITFGMGVVSGVVMSYQFGTNWSVFAHKTGNVLGPLLGYEVLTAFFLEASFLGIMLFGWGKVSEKMHFISTLVVAVGTLLSAFWILSANSWMHTPQGFEIREDGLFYPTSWMEIIFNPSFSHRFFHMVVASYLTTSFVISGVAGYYMLKKQFIVHSKKMLEIIGILIIILTPIQIFIGDSQGLNTLKYQPRKIAAIESIWDTETGTGLKLFGWPNEQKQTTEYSVEIPKLGSIILTHKLDGIIKGLKSWSRDEIPPVKTVFFAFRIMVGVGLLMLGTSIAMIIFYRKKQLFTNRKLHRWLVIMSPSGFVALLSGWFVTEVGRQPYIVYGILKTKDAISPVIGEYVLLSLVMFIITYTFVFGAGIHYLLKLIKHGPKEDKQYEDMEWHVEPAVYKELVLKNIKKDKK